MELTFANSRQTLGSVYIEYQRVRDFWTKTLPTRVFSNVQYENLVGQTEAVVRELLEYCGLPWSPKCLEYFRTQRALKTASSVQVKTPVFTSSVGHWRNYESHIRELAAAMVGRPFALLSVNCDYTPEQAKDVMIKESITWPTWYDGDPRNRPPIQSRYHIQTIPAIFVQDTEGVIRGKDVHGKALRDLVEKLLKEREAKTGRAIAPSK